MKMVPVAGSLMTALNVMLSIWISHTATTAQAICVGVAIPACYLIGILASGHDILQATKERR